MENPYDDIQIANSAEILGRACTVNKSINKAIKDRLDTGKADWGNIRKPFIADKQIKNKLQINFPNSLSLSHSDYTSLQYRNI